MMAALPFARSRSYAELGESALADADFQARHSPYARSIIDAEVLHRIIAANDCEVSAGPTSGELTHLMLTVA